MSNFVMPVSSLMNAPVATIPAGAPLTEAHRLLQARGISCLAVTEGEAAVGVLSRTDLIRVGRFASRAEGGEDPPGAKTIAPALLSFPEGRTVADAMRREIVAVDPAASVASAAKTMVDRHIHRVFVMEGGALVGVLSTKEVLLAIRERRLTMPVAEAMASPAFTISLSATLSTATDRLDKAHLSGLCVVDESDWPVGTFTQSEAVAARDLPADTPIEEVMSYAMLCVDVRTPLYRAAGYAHATRARRVLAVEGRQVKGVLTGLDFARVAAG